MRCSIYFCKEFFFFLIFHSFCFLLAEYTQRSKFVLKRNEKKKRNLYGIVVLFGKDKTTIPYKECLEVKNVFLYISLCVCVFGDGGTGDGTQGIAHSRQVLCTEPHP